MIFITIGRRILLNNFLPAVNTSTFGGREQKDVYYFNDSSFKLHIFSNLLIRNNFYTQLCVNLGLALHERLGTREIFHTSVLIVVVYSST